MARLKPHQGKTLKVQLQGWPTLLPRAPRLQFAITPAGLFEWQPAEDSSTGSASDAAQRAADLTLRVDAANPARLVAQALMGQRPSAAIEGDAALAAELDWLAQNLRWDIASDLERVLPMPVAQGLYTLGKMAAQALRAAAQSVQRMRTPAAH